MNATRRSLFMTIGAVAIAIAAQAASPAGVWTVNANGYTGTMNLSLDGGGGVTGTFLGMQMKGFWNSSSGELTVYRAYNGSTSSVQPDLIQIFTGYMFPYQASNPNGLQYITGSFVGFTGTGNTAAKHVNGWYAYKYQ